MSPRRTAWFFANETTLPLVALGVLQALTSNTFLYSYHAYQHEHFATDVRDSLEPIVGGILIFAMSVTTSIAKS